MCYVFFEVLCLLFVFRHVLFLFSRFVVLVCCLLLLVFVSYLRFVGLLPVVARLRCLIVVCSLWLLFWCLLVVVCCWFVCRSLFVVQFSLFVFIFGVCCVAIVLFSVRC